MVSLTDWILSGDDGRLLYEPIVGLGDVIVNIVWVVAAIILFSWWLVPLRTVFRTLDRVQFEVKR